MGCTSSVILPENENLQFDIKAGAPPGPSNLVDVEYLPHEPMILGEDVITSGLTYSGFQEGRDYDNNLNILDNINECDEYSEEGPVNNCDDSDDNYHIEPVIPQVYLDHVIGLDDEKTVIKEIIDTFVFNFDDFAEVGMSPTKGILLIGQAGCGKSLIAEAFACKYAFNFVSVKVVELTEGYARKLIVKVKEAAPCVLLLKHLDGVIDAENKKEIKKALNQITGQIIDVSIRIFVFATSYKVKNIDSTLLRNGRLEKTIRIRKPDQEARITKWRALLGQPSTLFYKCNVDFNELADITRGFSHVDLENICKLTFKNCGITMDISSQTQAVSITREHLVNAIKEYHDFTREHSMIEHPD